MHLDLDLDLDLVLIRLKERKKERKSTCEQKVLVPVVAMSGRAPKTVDFSINKQQVFALEVKP